MTLSTLSKHVVLGTLSLPGETVQMKGRGNHGSGGLEQLDHRQRRNREQNYKKSPNFQATTLQWVSMDLHCFLHQAKTPHHSSSWWCFQPAFAFLSDCTDAQKNYDTPELALHSSTAQLIREQEISALSPMPIFIAIYYSLKMLTRFPRANPWRTRSPSSTKLHNLNVISAPALTKK